MAQPMWGWSAFWYNAAVSSPSFMYRIIILIAYELFQFLTELFICLPPFFRFKNKSILYPLKYVRQFYQLEEVSQECLMVASFATCLKYIVCVYRQHHKTRSGTEDSGHWYYTSPRCVGKCVDTCINQSLQIQSWFHKYDENPSLNETPKEICKHNHYCHHICGIS